MDITFIPDLEHKTIMDYAFAVRNNRDIKNLVEEFKIFDQNNFGWTDVIDQGQWQFLHGKVKIVLSKMINPIRKELQNRVVGSMRPIYIETQRWMDDHRYIERTSIDIQDGLYWTIEGLIDRETTAKELVTNEHLSIQSRFELACNYCFMYDVENLWNLMSVLEKRRYFGKNMQNNKIVDFWTKWVTTGARKDLLLSPDRDFDQLCFNAYYTNSTALSYFLQKLTTEDRETYLTKIAKEKYLISRVIHFCLLEMDSNQKAEMFKKNPFKALKCFLEFPWQNAFLVMSLHLWPYLRKTDFVHLIYFIIYERIVPEWDDYYYIELLAEFWIQSPFQFKEYVKNQAIFRVLSFIVGQAIVYGYVYKPDLHKFLNDFILPKTTEEKYQKACRSC